VGLWLRPSVVRSVLARRHSTRWRPYDARVVNVLATAGIPVLSFSSSLAMVKAGDEVP